jgi:hypothetical protein
MPPAATPPPAVMPPPAAPPTGTPPPVNSACADPAKDAFPLLQKECGAMCHNPGNPALFAASLDLYNPNAKARLIGAASKVCPGKTLIVDSPMGVSGHLFDKMEGAPPGCGTRMPPIGKALAPEVIKCIKDWIRPAR